MRTPAPVSLQFYKQKVKEIEFENAYRSSMLFSRGDVRAHSDLIVISCVIYE